MCCFFRTQGPGRSCFSSTGYLEKAATGWKIWLTTALASSSQTPAMMCGWQTAGGLAGPGDTSAFQRTRWNSGISGGLERCYKSLAMFSALGRGGCLAQGGWRELSRPARWHGASSSLQLPRAQGTAARMGTPEMSPGCPRLGGIRGDTAGVSTSIIATSPAPRCPLCPRMAFCAALEMIFRAQSPSS